jgi:hypothetical protein
MAGFRFEAEDLALPKGAFAGARRHWLYWDERPLLALTQGSPRCYLYPVFTLNGFAVTAESPADHPHHNSLWVAADHVHCAVPAHTGPAESYTYNFYVNSTFQGRAPGNQLLTACQGAALDDDSFRLMAEITWRGPSEWGAPDGRPILIERRTTTISISPDRAHYTIDVTSALTAPSLAVSIGPTRHALFNVRAADVMRGEQGVRLMAADGTSDPAAINAGAWPWVSVSGPVGGGHRAGLVVAPGEGPNSWFVAHWGVVTVGGMRARGIDIAPGETLTQTCRILVHDGPAEDIAIPTSLAEAREKGSIV